MVCRLSLRSAVALPIKRTASRRPLSNWRDTHAETTGDMDVQLPELPETPRYPCPFITASDIEKYLVPLYRTGWGISHTPSDSSTKPRTPATQLSKSIMFPNPDLAGIFMTDVVGHITEPENHHPTWEAENDNIGFHSVHIHTHSALAPAGRQNAGDQEVFKQKRPGITLRDIRWVILFEGLLRNYIRQGLLEHPSRAMFPQPMDIDSVHNFRALPSQPEDPRHTN